MQQRSNRKKRAGVVVKDKMNKTIVVRLDRVIKHPVYKRIIKQSSKFMVHDEKKEAKVGDRVKIQETRPETEEVAPTPTLATIQPSLATKTPTSTPTVAKPQPIDTTNTPPVTPTPTIAQPPSQPSGPTVHLPDSTPQSTLATPTQPTPPDQKPAPTTIVTEPVDAAEQQKTVQKKSDENNETSKEVSEDNVSMG